VASDYNTITDLLQERIRQIGNVAVTQNFATNVLSRCERIINAYTGSVTAVSNFSSIAEQLFYDYRATLTSAIDITEISESNRTLTKCASLADLSALDIDWFRNITGTRFEAWCQIARDTLVVYPAKAAAGTNDLSITYTKLPAAYATYAAAGSKNFELPDRDVELAIALAEIILLARGRAFETISTRIKQFTRTLSAKEG